MRVISQDGKIDVPYEQISIEVRDNEIWCGYNATLGKDCIAKRFAIYSTEEKADKAMQKLHNCYQEWAEGVVFHFPSEDEIR